MQPTTFVHKKLCGDDVYVEVTIGIEPAAELRMDLCNTVVPVRNGFWPLADNIQFLGLRAVRRAVFTGLIKSLRVLNPRVPVLVSVKQLILTGLGSTDYDIQCAVIGAVYKAFEVELDCSVELLAAGAVPEARGGMR